MKRIPAGIKLSVSFICFSALLIALLLAFSGFARQVKEKAPSDPLSASPAVTVVLDAGHGGEDGGAVGQNGALEKDLNLALTNHIADTLWQKGISVLLTRTEDILLYDRNEDYHGRKKLLDLAARLKVARNTENAVFVSIHMNSFPQTQYRGLQVYYSKNHPASAALAESIQTAVRKGLQPENTRKTKAASGNIYLLDRITSPAVLVECGFLSNAEECVLLSDPAYQKQMAAIIADAIADYIAAHP